MILNYVNAIGFVRDAYADREIDIVQVELCKKFITENCYLDDKCRYKKSSYRGGRCCCEKIWAKLLSGFFSMAE